MSPPPLSTRQRLGRTAAIGALLAAAVGGLLYLSDRLGPARQARQFIDTLEASGARHAGYRRAHSHGVCVAGWFEPKPALAQLSRAAMFTQTRIPAQGRLSIGGGGPEAAEAAARVRSLALQLTGEDGQQWRLAMNSFPFFAMPSAEAFLEQVRAQTPDPATGKPDPAAIAALQARYPSARAFAQWARAAPWTDSWANTGYNGIHTFYFVDADGQRTPLRWSFVPLAEAQSMSEQQRQQAPANYLSTELAGRLAQGPVGWTLQLQLAEPGDELEDPSIAWPSTRRTVDAGTLWIDAMQPQQGGYCDGVNFDPTVVPDGIAISADPILAARSAVYAQSWNRRLQEQRQAAEATP